MGLPQTLLGVQRWFWKASDTPFFQVLADALRMNQRITELNLRRCEIGDDGLKAWRWWNTGMWGALIGSNRRSFFSGSMCRQFADTENLDSSYLWDLKASQVAPILEFKSFFQVEGMPSENIILVWDCRDWAAALAIFVNKYGIASNPSWVQKRIRKAFDTPLFQALADALRMNQTITQLGLHGMPSEKMTFVSVSLRVIRLTHCLHLFQVLADALHINRTIQTIGLSSNQIGDVGIKVWWVERCGVSPGSCVRVDSGWVLLFIKGSHGKSPDLIEGFIVEPWLFRIRLLDSLLEHMISILFLNIKGMTVYDFLLEDQSLWEGHAGWISSFLRLWDQHPMSTSQTFSLWPHTIHSLRYHTLSNTAYLPPTK